MIRIKNKKANKRIEKAICLNTCGKHQNEKVKRHFEKAICLNTCGKHQNEKVKRHFEKAICLNTCGKHQNEKVKRHFEKAICLFADLKIDKGTIPNSQFPIPIFMRYWCTPFMMATYLLLGRKQKQSCDSCNTRSRIKHSLQAKVLEYRS